MGRGRPSTTQRKRLINGRMMTCPRCKQEQELLSFVPLMMIEEFAEDTTPVYKCSRCRWTFAPAEVIPVEILERGLSAEGGANGGAS